MQKLPSGFKDTLHTRNKIDKPTMVIVFVLLVLGLTMVTNYLWNWLMPKFNLPVLTYWETMGFIALVNLIFLGRNYKG